jgi:hypothetical protein
MRVLRALIRRPSNGNVGIDWRYPSYTEITGIPFDPNLWRCKPVWAFSRWVGIVMTDDGFIPATSPDGKAWTTHGSFVSNPNTRLNYELQASGTASDSFALFGVEGGSGTTHFLVHTSDGVNFTVLTNPIAGGNYFSTRNPVIGNGVFLCGGKPDFLVSGTNTVYATTDFLTFTPILRDVFEEFSRILFQNGVYFGLGAIPYKSTDLVNWSEVQVSLPAYQTEYETIFFAGGYFWIWRQIFDNVSLFFRVYLYRSTNLTTWTQIPLPGRASEDNPSTDTPILSAGGNYFFDTKATTFFSTDGYTFGAMGIGFRFDTRNGVSGLLRYGYWRKAGYMLSP